MLSLIFNVFIIISAAATTYISYAHKVYKSNGRFTIAAKVFIGMLCLSIFFTAYLAYDNYTSGKDNEKDKHTLQNKVINVSDTLRLVLFKLDSLGYKWDAKTGNITQINITATTVIDQKKKSSVREITDKDLQKLLKEDPPKNISICFFYYRYPDRETESVKAQIRKLLEAKGFTNICPDNDINSEYLDTNLPLPNDDLIQIQMEEDFVKIGIPPRKIL